MVPWPEVLPCSDQEVRYIFDGAVTAWAKKVHRESSSASTATHVWDLRFGTWELGFFGTGTGICERLEHEILRHCRLNESTSSRVMRPDPARFFVWSRFAPVREFQCRPSSQYASIVFDLARHRSTSSWFGSAIDSATRTVISNRLVESQESSRWCRSREPWMPSAIHRR